MFWKIQILFAHLTWAVFWTKYLIFMFRTYKQERLFKFTIARDSTKVFCAALSQFVKPPPRMRKNGCANPGHNRPKLLKQVVNAFFFVNRKARGVRITGLRKLPHIYWKTYNVHVYPVAKYMIGTEWSFNIEGSTPTMTRGLRLKWSSMTLAPAAERLEVETTCFYF